MELDSLISEAVAWINKQREAYLPSSVPLDQHQKSGLNPFFPHEILDRARIVDLSQSNQAIPYPPFYETVRAGGNRVIPDAAHMTGMPFGDLIAFNQKPTLRTVFHNLVHVTQFVFVGTIHPRLFQNLERSGTVDGRALRGASLPIGRPLHAKSIGHFLCGKRSPGMDEGGTLLIDANW
jgi:hypothetical protein